MLEAPFLEPSRSSYVHGLQVYVSASAYCLELSIFLWHCCRYERRFRKALSWFAALHLWKKSTARRLREPGQCGRRRNRPLFVAYAGQLLTATVSVLMLASLATSSYEFAQPRHRAWTFTGVGPLNAFFWPTITPVDCDLDGDLDLIVSHHGSGFVFMLNTGLSSAPAFTITSSHTGPGAYYNSFATGADFNKDGFVDVVTMFGGILWNNGVLPPLPASFIRQDFASLAPSSSFDSAVAVDLNLDGDMVCYYPRMLRC